MLSYTETLIWMPSTNILFLALPPFLTLPPHTHTQSFTEFPGLNLSQSLSSQEIVLRSLRNNCVHPRTQSCVQDVHLCIRCSGLGMCALGVCAVQGVLTCVHTSLSETRKQHTVRYRTLNKC